MGTKVNSKVRVKVVLSEADGNVLVYRNKDEIGHIEFIVQRSQITATDVQTDEEHQTKGYGRLMMASLQRFAREKNLPIYLFSVESAVKFYKSCGFQHIRKYRGECELHLKNVTNMEKQVSANDMVWIPKGKKKATVYV
jgi:GNAT superfamily N-acetyltransferase